LRKKTSGRRGFLLIEAALSLGLLTVLGLILLKLSLNVLQPRQWSLQQAVTDAYITYERAIAERIPFEDLTGEGSPWPLHPATRQEEVELGRLPGGTPIMGTVVRTRLPDAGNYPIAGGSGTEVTNPAAMEVWKVQSIVRYRVGAREYLKSRTVIRSQ
jgi:hypothetical protein